MIDVLFFARIREELGCDRLEVPWQASVADLDSLQAFLCRQGGARWQQALSQTNLIRAVNQAVANGNTAINDGDEVAFFPPVTGG